MKAFVVEKYGQDGLRAAVVPRPTVGDRDVLVKVSAASINPLDKMVRNGEFKQLLRYKKPFVLGHDVAGVVTQVGRAVRGFKVGDEVYARPRDLRIGTFAEYIAIDQADVALKPASLTCTRPPHFRWSPSRVADARRSRSGQARPEGARPRRRRRPGVDGRSARQAPRRARRHDGAHQRPGQGAGLGADEVVDFTTTDFADVLSGYDVVLDSLGGANLAKSLTVLRPGGLAISVVGPPDPAFAKQLGQPLLRPVMAVMSAKVRRQARKLGVRYAFFFMQANGAQLRNLAKLYDNGELRPVLDQRSFRFDQTPEALAYVDRAKPAARSSSRSTARARHEREQLADPAHRRRRHPLHALAFLSSSDSSRPRRSRPRSAAQPTAR